VIRRFHHADWTVEQLLAAKRADALAVSVVIPARDEEDTVAGIVRRVRDDLAGVGLVDEIVVVDDGSSDRTSERARDAGARVVAAGSLLGDEGWGPGKGKAMWEGLYAASGELIVYLDADVTGFSAHYVTGLLGPLLLHPGTAFVKAFYERPLDGRSGEGGRVTELAARPLLSVLFPHLAGVVQPLAGECAARREVLEQVPFTHGYGVDLGLLVDVAALVGTNSLAQVDLDVRVHRNRPLAELSAQATAVLCAALDRAGMHSADHEVLERPTGESVVVRTGTHPPLAELRAGQASLRTRIA